MKHFSVLIVMALLYLYTTTRPVAAVEAPGAVVSAATSKH
jgi:hypothetical protein